MDTGLEIGALASHRLLRSTAIELDRTLKDLVDARRRIRQSPSASNRRQPTGAIVCPHVHTPAGRGRGGVV